jgi:hypothetical protein
MGDTENFGARAQRSNRGGNKKWLFLAHTAVGNNSPSAWRLIRNRGWRAAGPGHFMSLYEQPLRRSFERAEN